MTCSFSKQTSIWQWVGPPPNDSCESFDGDTTDCDENGSPDDCEISAAIALDWIAEGMAVDCDRNGTLDSCDFEAGADDCNADGTLDVCQLERHDCNQNGILDDCEATTVSLSCNVAEFVRGDVDGNGVAAALLDSFVLLNWQFLDGPEPGCFDAADVDDTGMISALLDSFRLLEWTFTTGEPPPAPGPDECGVDPTKDDLDCREPPDCL